MYGCSSTNLLSVKTDVSSFKHMYSAKLSNVVCQDIGIELLKPTYHTSKSGMVSFMLWYNDRTGNSAITAKQLDNLDRLYDIKQLADDWSGHGSRPISEKVISISTMIIKNICEQPKLYPTGRTTIQMQYELEDKSYLEFEIFEEKIVCMKVPKRAYSEASVEVMKTTDMDKINAIVKEFYGR